MTNSDANSSGQTCPDTIGSEFNPCFSRPVGVWLAVVYLFTFAGLLMAARALFVYLGIFSFSQVGMMPCSDGFLLFRIGLGIAVATFAIFTWAGNNIMKHVLVASALIHFSIITYNNFQWIFENGITINIEPKHIGRMIGSIAPAAVIVWYFEISGLTDGFFSNRESRRGSYVKHNL